MMSVLAMAAPVILAMLGIPNLSSLAHAWDGGYGNGGYGLGGYSLGLGGYQGYGLDQQSPYAVGYQAGQSQAQNDYQSDLGYDPYCSGWHSAAYRAGFENGYYQEWTAISQQQTTNQGIDNNIKIDGNNNVVNVYNSQSSQQGLR